MMMSYEIVISPELRDILLKSQILAILDEYLGQDTITHVSLDIFDTLFRRACDEPSWVFQETASRLLEQGFPLPMEAEDYRLCRIEAEAQARRLSAAEDIDYDAIFAQLPFDTTLKAALMAQEIEIEKEVLYLDPFIQQILQRIKCRHKRIIFISDMYLPEYFLHRLVAEKCPNLTYDGLFVSSKIKLTKQSGALFQHVMSHLGIMPQQVLHIGDNLKADIKSAQRIGLATLHFDMPESVSDTLEAEKYYGVKLPPFVQHARKLAALSMPRELSVEEQFFYMYGAVYLGPILSSFAKWILESAKRLQVTTILPLMREGGIFSSCIQRQLAYQPQQYEGISCHPCYASRKATYLSAINVGKLKDAVSQTLMRRNYTVKDFCNEFGLDDARLLPLSYTPLALLDQIAIDGQDGFHLLSKVFDNNVEQVLQNIARSKSDMRDYFSTLIGEDPYLLVDLGGGGTIPHQVSRGLQRQPVVSLLMYCNHRGNKNSVHTPISAFLPLQADTIKGIKKLSRSPEIFEIVLVGVGGTTLGYQRNEAGEVLPRLADVHYSEQYRRNIMRFEEGVLAYQRWDHHLSIPGPTLDERIAYLRVMERIVECPTKHEVHYLGNLVHEDNFGSERSYKVINSSGIERIRREGVETFFRKFNKNMSYGERWLAWPQGAVSSLDHELITDYVGLRDARYKHSQAVESLIELAQSHQVHEVIVYGAGEFFECLAPELGKQNIRIRAVIDKKANFRRFAVCGHEVLPLAECDIPKGATVIIASASFIEEIKRDIFNTVAKRDITILSLH